MSNYPFPEILETNRLKLEIPTKESATKAYYLIDSCRDYLVEFLDWANSNYTLDVCVNSFLRNAESFKRGNFFCYFITNKKTNEIIGYISLMIKQNGVVSVGFWLGEQYQKQGYLQEALQALIDFSFKETIIERINIQTDITNYKSQKLAEKAGFVFDSLIYSFRLDSKGNSVDMYNYTLLKDTEKMTKLKLVEKQLKQLFKVGE
jgi:RimJ/RimL family protein N-acetyltransferase